jgi:4-carboxymuconolactone decarboxylase
MPKTFLTRLCGAILLSMTAAAQDRMPPIPADKMTEAQKKAAAELAAGPRGAYSSRGPFVPLVRSPELMSRVQKVGEYLRYSSSLPQKLVEMTVLMTARRWTQQFEWNAHYPLALKAGLKKDVADAIAEGRHPAEMTEDEETAYNFTTELNQNGSVSDPTYARAVGTFKEQGVIDLIAVNGYYSLLGMVMGVARTPLAPGDTPMLKPFPR